MPVAKEQIIADNNLNSVADVYTLLRDSFKDIFQELMEAELDASPGHEKIIKAMSKQQTNVTDIPPKHSKASMVNSRLMSQGTVTVNLGRSWFQSTRGIFPGLRRRYSPSMHGE